MLSKAFLADQRNALPFTVSDLLVGLESDDAREVLYQASNLKKKADACELPLLRDTAQHIIVTVTDKGLDAVRSLVPQLHQELEQAVQLINRRQTAC